MRAHDPNSRLSVLRCLLIATATLLSPAAALPQAVGAVVDPLANGPADPDLFPTPPAVQPARQPVKAAAYARQQGRRSYVRPANYQPNNQTPFRDDTSESLPAPAGPVASAKDPCAAVASKPLGALGISIVEPAGKVPDDLAAACWVQINSQGGGCAAARCWPMFSYQWEATCFYHNPLYFEEANLERYGYGCGDSCCCCLQPVASAGHFCGSVLALPYCMTAECPGDCVYTLGHYRPGDCNPWRWYWPTFDPVAAVAAGGIWTGLVFAIP